AQRLYFIEVLKHIPFVSFVDAGSGQHQTDELTRIYHLLQGREAVSFSGHTHTTENHAPGQWFEGWKENTGIDAAAFRHIIAGAASGAWFQGDFSVYGVPMALQRMGAPKGYFHVDFKGTLYRERYIGAGLGRDKGQWVGLNTPAFRHWYSTLLQWVSENPSEREAVPPYSINDLPDTKILTPEDFNNGTWLTANVWAGTSETQVKAFLSNGQVLTLERTQQGTGEGHRSDPEWVDPFAAVRQLSVARYAYQSAMGDDRAQGHQLFRGRGLGPSAPQPQRTIAAHNMHLWRVKLPELPLGVYTIEVVSTDRNGIEYKDIMTIEVRTERPARYWRSEVW
ncbi:MAG: calcineurin-like phosphoesterase C-terminal domain-containing protein, partial [Bacteroidota bacterium]